jgi:hypothetical protein
MRLLDWRRILVYTHRWLGIAGCVLFVAWFVSGIVMMYVRMPVLEEEERLARAPLLDLSRATLSPADAAAAVNVRADRVQVGMIEDRPVYRFGSGARQTIVYADTGALFRGLRPDQAIAAARRYAPGHGGAIAHDRLLTDPDQWTLQAGALMPIHRFTLDDEAGTHLYVSERTGDVVLRTTRRERFWAYLGPVIHWIYFTPLRRNGPLWSEVVIWSSVAGCAMCLSGLIWGLWRFSPAGRFRLRRVASHSPYAGFMKWHHYAGLLFGVAASTWIYSGLLSMGPFNWFATPGLTRAQREASTGGPLRLEGVTLDRLRDAVAVFERSFAPRELELVQFRGEPFWAASRAPAPDQAHQWMEGALWPRARRPTLERRYASALRPGEGTFTRFDDEAMHAIALAAMPGVPVEDAEWLHAYDGHYYDLRGSRALPVLRVRYADPQRTWLYLDPARGGIVQKSERVSRLRRWLYQGLHSLDFPFLYFRRPLWDLVVIVLSIGGTVLSVTTVMPAVRRLRRHARRLALDDTRFDGEEAQGGGKLERQPIASRRAVGAALPWFRR